MFFTVLVYVFNFDLFELSAAILETGLFHNKPIQVLTLGIRRSVGDRNVLLVDCYTDELAQFLF